jgi:hypothetical protein
MGFFSVTSVQVTTHLSVGKANSGTRYHRSESHLGEGNFGDSVSLWLGINGDGGRKKGTFA